MIAPAELLADEHGAPYISWELRGGRVCIAGRSAKPGRRHHVVCASSSPFGVGREPPFPGLRVRRVAAPYVLWEATGPVGGKSPCPLIAVRQARQGPAR